jgi:phosphatidylglycerol---prolipoprotein diacylglyceryl transferase
MIPFLHLGPLSIPTYGLMVATGLLVAAYILQADLNRRRGELGEIAGYKGEKDDGFLVIGLAGIAGLVGSRIYSALESPREFWADPGAVLFSRFGFTWFGGLLGGFLVLVFIARRRKIPVLLFLDIASPAGAIGYAFGRMGCLLSGDGDYGVATTLPWGMSFPNGIESTIPKCLAWGLPADCKVHPTPVYESLVAVMIGVYLWHLGTKAMRVPIPQGRIFGNYLVLTGIARFLVEFIRINPKVLWGMTNAQVFSLVCIVGGIVLMLRGKPNPQQARSQA